MKNSGLPNPTLWQRILAGGCPLPSESSDEPEPDLKIEASRREVSRAYDRPASTEYALWLRITNSSYSPLQLQRYRAQLEWPAHLIWLGDPRVYSPDKKMYRLIGGREFACETVLNHRVGDQGSIEPGKSLEGVLLAYTLDRITFDWIHGDKVLAMLSVTDQYGRRHRSPIEFLIDRSATMRPPVPRPIGDASV